MFLYLSKKTINETKLLIIKNLKSKDKEFFDAIIELGFV
jgi:hypothetical protein